MSVTNHSLGYHGYTGTKVWYCNMVWVIRGGIESSTRPKTMLWVACDFVLIQLSGMDLMFYGDVSVL